MCGVRFPPRSDFCMTIHGGSERRRVYVFRGEWGEARRPTDHPSRPPEGSGADDGEMKHHYEQRSGWQKKNRRGG